VNDFDANFSVDVYPNPFNEQTTVSIDARTNAVVDITLTDISGKSVILSQRSALIKGENQIELQLAELAKGFYLLNVQNGETRRSIKVLKN